MACRECRPGELPIGQGPWECEGMCEGEVQDFAGAIDGGGVKQSLTVPKRAVDLVVPQYIKCIADVLAFGKRKYAKHNWMRGISFEEILAGMERHRLAIRRGEEVDAESGLPHACHLATGNMFLYWYLHGPQREQYAQFDDRVFKQSPTQLEEDDLPF